MAKRKTFNVDELIDIVNGICKDSAADRKEVRQGAMNVLEAVLHKTGNYSGFNYLRHVADGAPGVNYVGDKLLDYPERFENTDRTRVFYYK
jgi:hypothetical protein